jgi:hypothetical protein
MRNILIMAALGAGAYALTRRKRDSGADGSHAAFADDQSAKTDNPVRDAGPDAMRDPPRRAWSTVDEESDQSFPASDPPGNY